MPMDVTRHDRSSDPVIPHNTRIVRVERENAVLLLIAPVVGVAGDGEAGDDIASQVVQTTANLDLALASQGAGLEHVVRVTSYTRADVDLAALWELDETPSEFLPTGALTVVDSLADPAWLHQLEVVALIPR